jgi:uncharacterized membrane protein
MTFKRLGSGESKLETGISYLLIAGVIVSLLLEIVGIILLYRSYGSLDVSRDADMYIRGRDFFTFMLEQFQGKHVQGNAIQFITAGIIVLILTPYIRVIGSVLYFIWEKNTKYVLITLFVLIIVTSSLALH